MNSKVLSTHFQNRKGGIFMEHTFDELKHKTIKDLRAVAKEIDHEAVQGYSQMNKDHLLEAVCKALNIDMFEHHVAKTSNKSAIKARIRNLKKKRDETLASKDHKEFISTLRQIKHLKRELRRAAI